MEGASREKPCEGKSSHARPISHAASVHGVPLTCHARILNRNDRTSAIRTEVAIKQLARVGLSIMPAFHFPFDPDVGGGDDENDATHCTRMLAAILLCVQKARLS